MPVTIKAVTIGGTPDNFIQMNNGLFGRALPMGTDWSIVRVGLRGLFTNSGVNLTGTPKLWIAVGNGTTQMIGDGYIKNAIVLKHTTATWGYSAGYFQLGDSWSGEWITNNAFQGGISPSFGGGPRYPNSDKRGVWYVDFRKSQGGIRLFCPTSPSWDISATEFYNNMTVDTPTINGHGQSAMWSFGWTPSEANGAFDTAQVYWDRADSYFQISDFAVAKLA